MSCGLVKFIALYFLAEQKAFPNIFFPYTMHLVKAVWMIY